MDVNGRIDPVFLKGKVILLRVRAYEKETGPRPNTGATEVKFLVSQLEEDQFFPWNRVVPTPC